MLSNDYCKSAIELQLFQYAQFSYEILILYINIAESEIKLEICTTATSGDEFLPSDIDVMQKP